MNDLISRAALAARFGISEKTLRRHLPTVPGLTCVRLGRTIYFTEADVQLIERALRQPYPGSIAAKAAPIARANATTRMLQAGGVTPEAAVARMRTMLEAKKRAGSRPKKNGHAT